MKDFPGTPGTLTGLALRISQCVFAIGSIACMATTPSFFNFTAFCYLIASMGLQVIWSFVLSLLDAFALIRKKVLHNPVLVSLFVVGDWVTATLSLAAASASAGIAVLYFNDAGHCHFGEECQKYQISVALAFMSWVTAAFSLAAASASARIAVLYFNDVGHCHFGEECRKYQISVALAFMSWVTTLASSLIMLWLLAAG